MKKLLIMFIVTALCILSFTGCNRYKQVNGTEESNSVLTVNSEASQAIQSSSSNLSDDVFFYDRFIIDSNGEKKIFTQSESEFLEKTASILAQQILTFTDVANTENSAYPEDFDTDDIISICVSGGAFSKDKPYFYDFEHEEFYPYKNMGAEYDGKFVISRENCQTIAKELFGRSDLNIKEDSIEFEKSFGGYGGLMLNKGTYSIDSAVWYEGILIATVTIKLNKGDRIKYKVDFLPKESDGNLYLQLKEIHKGLVQISFEADDYIKDLYPQLKYTIVSSSTHGEQREDMSFYGTCLYYENQGESGELFSFKESIAGNEDYSINDNYYRTRRNVRYLIENANKVYAKDARTKDSTGYENIPKDSILVASTYENTAPVKVRYIN